MTFDPEIHHRRSARLQGYDYSRNGAYFITICTHGKQNLFGEIIGGEMRFNEFGEIALEEWSKTAIMRPNIELDEFIVMTNHVHGIISIIASSRGIARNAPTQGFSKLIANSIPVIVRAYKSAVTKRINAIRKMPGVSFWQRNYYEHVIRNDGDLNRIREYIEYNPDRWADDEENPVAHKIIAAGLKPNHLKCSV